MSLALQLTAVAGAVSAVLGCGILLSKAAVWVGRTLRKLNHLADDLIGEEARPGRPATPGLLQRVATIEDHVAPLPSRLDDLDRRLAAVEAQLQPNGGTTVRDKVDRIADAIAPE